jgi:hypothetical protein
MIGSSPDPTFDKIELNQLMMRLGFTRWTPPNCRILTHVDILEDT